MSISCPGFQDRDLSRALREKTDHLSETVKKLAERMDTVLAGVEQARQEVQSTCSVPGAAMEAEWRSADNSYKKLVVPCGTAPVNMFAPTFWSAFAPLSFPYGDGVFGLERDQDLTYMEWCCYLMDREELEYALPGEEAAGAGPRDPVPRWRADSDLLTAMYCLWRRKRYIQCSRSLVQKPVFRRSCEILAGLKPEDLYHACSILGKGAGVKEALASSSVPDGVKQALRCMLICNSSIVGSDAHRTVLRHVNTSYRVLFGPPLVFTTPNIADAKNLVMSLLYEGAPVCKWRLLEEDAPDMPSAEDMLRRVAKDPVSQAEVFNLMMELFLEHVLGVSLPGRTEGVSDGVAASGAPGVFGFVRAYLGPVETQGRGGLHPHMHVWVLHPMMGSFFAALRAGESIPELESLLMNWRRAVMLKVASLQFDSVEEFGRQLGLDAGALRPLPLNKRQRWGARCDGQPEEDDLAVFPPPVGAPRDAEWAMEPPCGPRRQRPFAPLGRPEPDPHEAAHEFPRCRRVPMTGSHLTLQPQYRRKPPYRTMPDGSALIHIADAAGDDALNWARHFAEDARLCFVKSHIHRCMPTCWKMNKKHESLVQVCRFNFHHEYATAVFRRKAPKPECTRSSCPMVGCTVLSGECRGFQVHPARCPVHAATPVEKKFLRRGKALVLPRDAGYVLVSGVDDAEAVMFVVDGADQDAFMAHVHTQKKYGRLGRIDVLRYHPFASSTNPCGQVLLRCNWDVQCMDRVFVVDGVVGEVGAPESTIDGAVAPDQVCSGATVDVRSCGHTCVCRVGLGVLLAL